MMLVSNFCFDLFYFYALVNQESGFWAWFARATAGLFIFLVGVSLVLSTSESKHAWRKLRRRGLAIFGLGMVISLGTWMAVGDSFVVFGVLHLIGAGILLSYPFLRSKWLSLCGGLLIFLFGFVLAGIRVDFPWLLFVGLAPHGFASVDYTPLVPWFGVMLVGIFCGQLAYPHGRSRFVKPALADGLAVRGLRFLGQHSLLIYFGHQPLFWAGFWVVAGW